MRNSGAGKSTTIKMLTGIITPTTGEILINGKTQGKDRKSINKEISVVLGQKSQLWWDLPVVDSLKIAKSMYGLDEYNYKENYDVLNSMLDIESIINVPVRQLSLGQRMKADLCFALIHNPKIIFLDEPTIGLDIITKEQVHNCIKYLNKHLPFLATKKFQFSHVPPNTFLTSISKGISISRTGIVNFAIVILSGKYWRENAPSERAKAIGSDVLGIF